MLRILCLHGYTQNGQAMSARMGALRKHLKARVQFVFVTAPNAVHDEPDNTQFTWWVSDEDGQTYRHADTSLRHVADVLRAQGPFDGVMGFSQGAAFAALLSACLLHVHAAESAFGVRLEHPPFKFSILVSGFYPRSADAQSVLQQGVDARSLFVIGKQDEIIPRDKSERLAECFSHTELYYHNGGHVIPGDKAFKEALDAFLGGESRL